jgi:hypothetical protein
MCQRTRNYNTSSETHAVENKNYLLSYHMKQGRRKCAIKYSFFLRTPGRICEPPLFANDSLVNTDLAYIKLNGMIISEL